MKQTVQALVVEVGELLKDKNLTLVTAESCTGGGLSYYISISPNVSAILERGYVTYSNHSKEDLLKVSARAIQIHGAVSKQVAIEMAEGALKNSKAQISIAITGIAGPDKKSKGKQETGTVWIACARFDKKTSVKLFHIRGQRSEFCDKTILEALRFLKKYV